MRRAARKAVRAAASEGFEELDRRLREVRTLQNRATRRANREANLYKPKRWEVGSGHWLVPLEKADQLEDVGERLGVCVANRRTNDARPYFERLENGTCTYFLLGGPGGEALGLMEVEDGRIAEVAGPHKGHKGEFELPTGPEGRKLAFRYPRASRRSHGLSHWQFLGSRSALPCLARVAVAAES